MRNMPRYAARLALVLALGFGALSNLARPQAPAGGGPGASKLPDILGMTTGMTLQQAYDLLKAHDPAHSIALEQFTIPQLYGDKPIAYGLTPSVIVAEDKMYVGITTPPEPQLVWLIHREIGPFTSTYPNVLDGLYQKYGTPWTQFPPGPRPSSLTWLHDGQGRTVNPKTPADIFAMKTCVGTMMGFWSGYDVPMPSLGVPTAPTLGNPRSVVTPMPPGHDLVSHPLCENLIQVTVGITSPDGLKFYMTFEIGDFHLQHRTYVALNDAINAVVQRGAQQQKDNASKQAVPKL